MTKPLSEQPDPERYARSIGEAMMEYWALIGLIRTLSWVAHDPGDYSVGQRATRRLTDQLLIDHFMERAKAVANTSQLARVAEQGKELHRLRTRRNDLIHSMYLLPATDGWVVPNERVDPHDFAEQATPVETVTEATFDRFRKECRAAHASFWPLAFELFGEPSGFERL